MHKQSQHGIALIQVLLISAILSVLAIQLNKSAQLNTQLTIDFDAKMQAEIALRDAENFIYFSLLTDKQSLKSQLPSFNYYNDPVKLSDDIVIRIQDTGGLLNAHFPRISFAQKITDFYQLPNTWPDSFVDQLIDWQDSDDDNQPFGAESRNYQSRGYQAANVKLSLVEQFRHLIAVEQDVADIITPLYSTFSYSSFNPYNAPRELLAVLYGRSVAERLVDLRQSGSMNREIFSTLTDVREGEGVSFITSHFLQVTISSQIGNATVKKLEVVELQARFKAQELPISRLYSVSY